MFLGGMASLGTAALVHLVTLPTELDASFTRAMPMLEKGEILHPGDAPHARRLLTAAAFTYVAASLASLLVWAALCSISLIEASISSIEETVTSVEDERMPTFSETS